MSARSKVKEGALALDRQFPDWHWRVNSRELDMKYDCHCVLGHLFGSYEVGKDKLNIDDEQAYKLGFLSIFQRKWNLSDFIPWTGARLTRLWREEIKHRREADRIEYSLSRLPRYEERKLSRSK